MKKMLSMLMAAVLVLSFAACKSENTRISGSFTGVPTEATTEAATESPTETATQASTEAVTESPTETATQASTEAVTEAPVEKPDWNFAENVKVPSFEGYMKGRYQVVTPSRRVTDGVTDRVSYWTTYSVHKEYLQQLYDFAALIENYGLTQVDETCNLADDPIKSYVFRCSDTTVSDRDAGTAPYYFVISQKNENILYVDIMAAKGLQTVTVKPPEEPAEPTTEATVPKPTQPPTEPPTEATTPKPTQPSEPTTDGSADENEAWAVHSRNKAQVPSFAAFMYGDQEDWQTEQDGGGVFIDNAHAYIINEYISLLESNYHLKARDKIYKDVTLWMLDTNIVFDYVGDDPNAGTFTTSISENPTGKYNAEVYHDVQSSFRLEISKDSQKMRTFVRMWWDDSFTVVDYGERASDVPLNMKTGSGNVGVAGDESFYHVTAMDCWNCSGTGNCDKCGGDGYLWSSVLDKEQLNCYRCNTSGDCWLCHGTGKQKNWLVED